MEKQNNLFDIKEFSQAPDWEAADSSQCRVARVVFPDGPDGSFDYLIPEKWYEKTAPGERLLVPLGKSNRAVIVYCIDVAERYDAAGQGFKLKEILQPIDLQPLLSRRMLDLAQWISDRYLCPLGTVLEAVLPAGVRDQAGTRLTTVYSLISNAEEKLRTIAAGKAANKKGEDLPLLTSKQKRAYEILRNSPEPLTLTELAKAAKCTLVPINALKNMGLFQKGSVRRRGSLFEDSGATVPRRTPYILNEEQKAAYDRILEAIRNRESGAFLLHGITGSGKTEVYIQAIEEIVQYGKQAIVLVPEISLTPQTVRRFRERFDSIAVLHSNLTDSERHAEWARIASGKVQVVVGARSAIFAPLPNLGLIVIDEEHENSFKQNIAPRYHAREVALFRAHQEKIPLILGSATPSLESWHRQSTGEYHLLSIRKRVRELPLPMVHLIDLRSGNEARFTRGSIHRELHISIKNALDSGGQIILLLNRRGYSTQIQCPACGEVLQCPECEVALTHHKTEDIALCHYCDYQIPAPKACPKCGFTGIRYSGFGTERLEQELISRFPDIPILRMDTDTMAGHGAHERALDDFRSGKYRILLGTQMIAKGLDFPNVVLVGVINADTALHFPDFRASERTFHLITQVAGRTGRSERGGHVIVQTYSPDHPAILAARQHDFIEFAKNELKDRKEIGYPPFNMMIRFIIRGPDEKKTEAFAGEFAKKMREEMNLHQSKEAVKYGLRILGPAPAPFAKLRSNYRFHFFIITSNPENTLAFLKNFLAAQKKNPAEIEWVVDVDPLDML
ncbi:MAG: primosomal protein N' [Planctomycetia bacterium]|nr:primosomal protein N' [Planctomycetia bacterium]